MGDHHLGECDQLREEQDWQRHLAAEDVEEGWERRWRREAAEAAWWVARDGAR